MTALPWRRVHLTGVGGVGMAGIAHILADLEVAVTGSDAADSWMLESLRCRDLDVSAGHDAARVTSAMDVLVYSRAVRRENEELRRAVELGVRICPRGAFLAELSRLYDTVVAIGGSHGKTTTAALVAHLLRSAGEDPGFLVGGRINGWARSASAGARRLLVTEVDESDGSQALLDSALAVITNIDDDHCWEFGGRRALEACFAEFADRAASVLAWGSDSTRRVLGRHPACEFIEVPEESMPRARSLPGAHNRRNAALAVAAARWLGIRAGVARRGLFSFPGVSRRMSERLQLPGGRIRVVEDYAHHPTELAAVVEALRERYPRHRRLVVFQAHRYERVERYGRGFATVLGSVERALVIPSFSAWSSRCTRFSGEGIAGMAPEHVSFDPGSHESLAEKLTAETDGGGDGWVIAVIGAGSITGLIGPLAACLTARWRQRTASRLRAAFPDLTAACDLPWRDLTAARTGGGVPLRVRIRDGDVLRDLLEWARQRAIPWCVLENERRLVGTDLEPPRLVLSLAGDALSDLALVDERVAAGEGVRLRVEATVHGHREPGRADAPVAEAAPVRRSGHAPAQVFRAPPGSSLAALMERAGCTGMREGAVALAEHPAGTMVNQGDGSEEDWVRLVCRVWHRVRARTGECLALNIRFVGREAEARVKEQIRCPRQPAIP